MKKPNETGSWLISLSVVLLLFLLVAPVLADQFKVSRVVDGDTIKVRGASGELTIRLVGIDAPELSHKKREPGQPYSQQATKTLASWVLNKNVEIKEYGHDRHGRTLGVVNLEGKDINLEMVRAGLAEVYRGEPTRGFDMSLYWKAEEEAKRARKGMWIQGEKYVSPREWRHAERNRPN
jgi:micrococcal nuclease